MGGIVEQSEFAQHRSNDTVEIFTHFPVPTAEYAIAIRFEPGSAPCVSSDVGSLAVMHTVDFDNEVSFQAGKVNNVWSDRMLPAKSQTHGTAFTQVAPKDPLLVGHVTSQTSCEKVSHSGKGSSRNVGVN